MFTVEVRGRPDLLCGEQRRGAARPERRRETGGPPPEVHILPFLCEQGSRGEQARGCPLAAQVVPTLRRLFPGSVLRLTCENADENMASCFASFLSRCWPTLRRLNVIVTHGNFLRNELLAPAGLGRDVLANASVLDVLVLKAGERQAKRLLLVRHCLSHHNVSRRGSAKWTTCASLEALRCLARRLAPGPEGVLYGASALPRAILSSLALQQPISPEELESAADAFQASRASRWEIDRHVAARDRGCGAPDATRSSAFCSGARGSFILPFRCRQPSGNGDGILLRDARHGARSHEKAQGPT